MQRLAGRTDRELRDTNVTLLLAGHETTANALAWTFYLLSQADGVQTALYRELAKVLAGRLPGAIGFGAMFLFGPGVFGSDSNVSLDL